MAQHHSSLGGGLDLIWGGCQRTGALGGKVRPKDWNEGDVGGGGGQRSGEDCDDRSLRLVPGAGSRVTERCLKEG